MHPSSVPLGSCKERANASSSAVVATGCEVLDRPWGEICRRVFVTRNLRGVFATLGLPLLFTLPFFLNDLHDEKMNIALNIVHHNTESFNVMMGSGTYHIMTMVILDVSKKWCASRWTGSFIAPIAIRHPTMEVCHSISLRRCQKMDGLPARAVRRDGIFVHITIDGHRQQAFESLQLNNHSQKTRNEQYQ